jgi:hypothetical protein
MCDAIKAIQLRSFHCDSSSAMLVSVQYCFRFIRLMPLMSDIICQVKLSVEDRISHE